MHIVVSPEQQHYVLFMSNMEILLQRLELESIISLIGITENGHQLIGEVNDVPLLLLRLADETVWYSDVWFTHFGRPGVWRAFRSRQKPHVHIAIYSDGRLELDIDEYLPRWLDPVSLLLHFICEGLYHRVFKTRTSQERIRRMLQYESK